MLLPLRMRCHRLRAGICRAWPASGMIPSLCLTASSKYFRPQLYLRYLSLVSRLLSLYSCLLSSVSCLLYIISCLYIPVSCIMYLVSCLLSQVSCLTSPVSHLLSHVSCLTSPVSCFLSAVVLYCFSAEDAPKISQQTGDWRALLHSPHLWCIHRPPLYLLGAVFGCSRGWRGWGEGRRARQSTVCWEILHRASFIKIFCTLFKKYVLNLFQFFVPRPGMPLTDLQRLYIALHHFSSKNFIRSSANCRKVSYLHRRLECHRQRAWRTGCTGAVCHPDAYWHGGSTAV